MNTPSLKTSRAVSEESFNNINEPKQFVSRTEHILERVGCEVRTDFDKLNQLFFIEVADEGYIDVVEAVLNELERTSSYCYRESEDEFEQYEASYVGGFIQNTTPTTEGEKNEL